MKVTILAALKLDILFQFRSGFHAIYIGLCILYIGIINNIPKAWEMIVVPLMIFSDPAVLGFFFIGGLVMLEKSQGIMDLIVVTPIKARDYLLSKVISLNLIALLASLAIVIFTKQSYNMVLLVLAILMTSSFFTTFGFYIALTSRSMNHYFGRVIPGMMLIIIPVFSLVGFPYSKLFYICPSVAATKLIIDAFFGTNIMDTSICLVIMLMWNVIIHRMVVKSIKRHSVKAGVNIA